MAPDISKLQTQIRTRGSNPAASKGIGQACFRTALLCFQAKAAACPELSWPAAWRFDAIVLMPTVVLHAPERAGASWLRPSVFSAVRVCRLNQTRCWRFQAKTFDQGLKPDLSRRKENRAFQMPSRAAAKSG